MGGDSDQLYGRVNGVCKRQDEVAKVGKTFLGQNSRYSQSRLPDVWVI